MPELRTLDCIVTQIIIRRKKLGSGWFKK